VLLSSRRFAEEIISAASLPPAMKTPLAVALSKGGGIAKEGNKLCVVLRSPLLACQASADPFFPTVVAGEMPTRNSQRRFRTTSQVAQHIVTKTKPGRRPHNRGYLAPAGSHALRVGLSSPALDGIEPIEVAHGNEAIGMIKWYDLGKIPEGSFIYIVDNEGGISFFQRVGEDHWVLVAMNGNQDVADLRPLMSRLAAVHGPRATVDGLQSLIGPPVYLRRPTRA
jgi:hypothetical protein